jgi:hypothetical protein
VDKIIEQNAKFIPNLPGISSSANPESLRCAETINNDQWVAKTTEWPWAGCRDYSLRVGVEYAYYALAQHNGLNMTNASVLKVGEEICWATKILPDRNALVAGDTKLTKEQQEELREGLVNSQEERSAFLRLVFLDVFLLGADRKASNVLKQIDDDRLRLFPIDHGQSLGWRNNIEDAENNRIRSGAEEYARITAYTQLEAEYHWGAIVSTPKEREEVFNSLKLDAALLDQLKPWIPLCWFPKKEFDDRKAGLVNWWEFLKGRPYPELDKRIFG